MGREEAREGGGGRGIGEGRRLEREGQGGRERGGLERGMFVSLRQWQELLNLICLQVEKRG